MPSDWNRTRKFAVIIGVVGIVIEVIAVFLLAQKRIPSSIGTPLVVAGMFLAFVPIFVMARRHKKT